MGSKTEHKKPLKHNLKSTLDADGMNTEKKERTEIWNEQNAQEITNSEYKLGLNKDEGL